MRFALSNDHYAAAWPLEENYKLEDITQLGVRYASLEEGPEKQGVLLSIVRCFHVYLMKYTEMVQRGHIPIYKNRMNRDSANFLGRVDHEHQARFGKLGDDVAGALLGLVGPRLVLVLYFMDRLVSNTRPMAVGTGLVAQRHLRVDGRPCQRQRHQGEDGHPGQQQQPVLDRIFFDRRCVADQLQWPRKRSRAWAFSS